MHYTSCVHDVDENELLKKQLSESQHTLQQMEDRHHHQIKEAMSDLEAAREAHWKEVAMVQEAAQQQSRPMTTVYVCRGGGVDVGDGFTTCTTDSIHVDCLCKPFMYSCVQCCAMLCICISDTDLVLGRQEVEVMQRLLQDKTNEVKQLQKRLSDVEREKHTELVKLRLEVRIHTHTLYMHNKVILHLLHG